MIPMSTVVDNKIVGSRVEGGEVVSKGYVVEVAGSV